MAKTLILPGRFPGLNEYSKSERGNKYSGGKMKKEQTDWVMLQCRKQLKGVRYELPVIVDFLWIEPNASRDTDNIAFAKKFILDGLVKAEVLPNDNQKHVKGFTDQFAVDKENPRVEVSFRKWEG